MAEENTPVEPNEPQAPQLTEVEQRAQAQGWVPKEQWEGDPDNWRPAKEFLDRGELFKKIDEQNRTIKEFRKTLNEFAQHHAKVREVEYERALADLKTKKKTALLEGDADAVIDIDEKIDMVKDAKKQAAQPVEVPSVQEQNPVFVQWVERNSWYESSKPMRAYADKIGMEMAAEGRSPNEILQAVEREVKKEFASKFENPNRSKPGAVEGSGAKGSGGKVKDDFQLSDDERRAMDRFVRAGIISKEQYISDLKAKRGV